MREAIIGRDGEDYTLYYHFAPAVRAGGLLFLSGQLGQAVEGLTLADGAAGQIDSRR